MPSAKVIPLAARVPTPWTEEQPGHNPDQQQPGQPRPDITATRHPDRQHPKLVAGVDVAWDPLPEIRFRPLLWHAHAEGRGGQADGGQTNRRTGTPSYAAYWCESVTHEPNPWRIPPPPRYHTPYTTFFPSPCACPCGTFDWPCGLCLLLRERVKGVRGKAEILQNSIFG